VISRSRPDIITPILSGSMVLVLYCWTLQPAVGGPEDTPKFQYLGYVLGTAHSPGYPLYTILTHLPALVPIGSLAWRINLFSAVCGAITVGAAWGCARLLGASRIAATGAAVALGCGRYFWWNSILAEVYTLGTALLAGMTLFLLRWSGTRRDRDLHLAVACAALALGNHLTIAAVAPAAILFTLVVDWRRVLRPRTLLVNAAIGAAGLAQYLYIVVRTRQHAAFLEARADNLAELLPIIAARRFSDDVFTFSWTTLVGERLPDLLRHTLGELGWCGAAFAVGGILVLIRRDWRKGVLVAGGAGGALYLAANVAADVKGFLMPVFTLVWPAAALGIDWLASRFRRFRHGPAAVAALAALLLPAGLVRANVRANDLSDRTATSRYFDAIFASLPARAAFVAEEYTTDAIVTYESIVHRDRTRELRRAVPPDSRTVGRLQESGVTVFAFESGARMLMAQGVDARRVVVRGPDLREVLDGFPPDHLIVVAAVNPGLPVPFAPSARHAGAWRAAGGKRHHVVLARPGRWDAAYFESRTEPFAIDIAHGSAPQPVGGALPRGVHVDAGRERALIMLGGQEAVRAEPGIAVAVVAPDGSVVFRQARPSGASLNPVLDVQHPELYEIGGPMQCLLLGDRAWHDVTAVAGSSTLLLRVDNYRPGSGSFVVYAASDLPFKPLLSPSLGSAPQKLSSHAYDLSNAAARAELARDLRRDAVTRPFDDGAPGHAVRIEASIPDGGAMAAGRLSFGTGVRQAIARGAADRVAAHRAAACAAPPLPVIGEWTASSGEVWLGSGGAEFFGQGWRGAEHDPVSDRPRRWTAGLRARLRVPIPSPRPTRVRLTVEPAPGIVSLALDVNGMMTPALPLGAGWQDVEWTVPASAWHAGVNDVWLAADGTMQTPGRAVHVGRIRLDQQ
jgi:hypothetical protein